MNQAKVIRMKAKRQGPEWILNDQLYAILLTVLMTTALWFGVAFIATLVIRAMGISV